MKIAKLRIFRIIITSILLISIVFLSAIALFIYFYPKDRFIEHISSLAEKALERKIIIGDLEYGLRGIVLNKVRLHDGKSEREPVLAESDEVNLRLSFLSLLLTKKLTFDSISLRNFKVNISYDDKGKSNLEKFIGELNSKKGNSNQSPGINSIRLSNAAVTLVNPPPILKPLEGRYHFTGTISFEKNSTVISDSTVHLPHNRGTLNPHLRITPLKDDFKIAGSVKLTNASILWTYGWGKNVTLPYDIINGNVTDLVITKNFVSGKAQATSTLRNFNKVAVANGGCIVNIRNQNVILSDIRGSIDESSFILHKLNFNFRGDLINFNVTDINANIEDVRPILDFLPQQLSGKVTGSIMLQNRRYNGNLQIKNVSFDAKNNLLTGLNAGIVIKENVFVARDIPVRLLGSPCVVSVASTDSAFRKIFVDVRAEKVAIDEKNFASSKSDRPMKTSVEIAGKINIGEIRHGPLIFTNLNINYAVSSNTLAINSLSVKYLGGNILGKGTVYISQTPPRATVAVQFSDIKIQNMAIIKEKFKDRFFGNAGGKANLEFNLDQNLYKEMTGRIEVNISKGKLVNTGIQNGLGVFLSELKYKLSDLEFKVIYGNFSLKGEQYTVNSIIFNSENIRLKIEGSINKDLVAKPLLINLEFNRHFIQDMPGPVALGLNKYLSASWYVIPFSCNGNVTDSKNIKLLR